MGNEMSEKKRIYLADDDYSIRDTLQHFLESAGYAARAFETGNKLLEEFKRNPCDLAILDIDMPGGDLNGFGVLKKIREISTIPIIILTANDSDMLYQSALDLGGDDFFIKPTTPMNIVMRVKSMFRRIEYERADTPKG